MADGQAVIGDPQIEGVALGLALGIEAAERPVAEVNREAPVPIGGRIVQRARPAAQGREGSRPSALYHGWKGHSLTDRSRYAL